jgi:3-oxoacyl-[acyl-carrier-protein] synthase II
VKSAYLVDCGVACALGNSLDELWPRLCDGTSAIAPVRRFCTDRLDFHQAACVPDLTEDERDNRICALARRALAQLRPVPGDTFVIWAGVKGNTDWIEARAAGQPPTALHLPRHYRDWVCRQLKLAGCGMEVNAACASSAAALAIGAEMIAQGECARVLICAADIVSRFTFMGFAALRALSPTICRPLDTDRDGLCLGDGAVAVLLADATACTDGAYQPLARIAGWGWSNDANHITGPARDAGGLTIAIQQALRLAGLTPDELQAWSLHGTGTVYNDAMELTALANVFGARRFPLFSVKGALGHTLGAAGAFEAVIGMRALRARQVPATAGLRTVEPRAAGRAASEPQGFDGDNLLTTNSGFGGVNAALVLTPAEGVA